MTSGDKIQFPPIRDDRGSLCFIEGEEHVPFLIRRIYYLFDVPDGAGRGGHAHKALEQVMIALHGSFDLVLNDGRQEQCLHLLDPSEGVYIGNHVWREIRNFSAGAVCVVLASERYDESDYIRDFEKFIQYIKAMA